MCVGGGLGVCICVWGGVYVSVCVCVVCVHVCVFDIMLQKYIFKMLIHWNTAAANVYTCIHNTGNLLYTSYCIPATLHVNC